MLKDNLAETPTHMPFMLDENVRGGQQTPQQVRHTEPVGKGSAVPTEAPAS